MHWLTKSAWIVSFIGVAAGCPAPPNPGGDAANDTGGADATTDEGVDSPVANDTGAIDTPMPTDTPIPTDTPTPSDVPAADAAFPSGTATITLQTSCPAFTACGGNVVGGWGYTNVCITPADLNLGSILTACPTATVGVTGTVTGGVLFTATTVQRIVNSTVNISLTLPGACVPTTCATIQAALQSTEPSATCTAAAPAGCNCMLTRANALNQTDTYTVSGNTLTVSNGPSSSTYDYCISGSTFTYRSTGGATRDPGLLTMTRR